MVFKKGKLNQWITKFSEYGINNFNVEMWPKIDMVSQMIFKSNQHDSHNNAENASVVTDGNRV